MKTDVETVVDWIEERHDEYFMDELAPEELVSEVFQAVVENELPELEQELERFAGKNYTTLGKIEFLEELRDEADMV